MNDTTMQMTAQIPTGLGTPARGLDLGVISGRAVLSGYVATSACATQSTTGTTIERDRQDSVLRSAKAFPGSPAWRPPIT